MEREFESGRSELESEGVSAPTLETSETIVEIALPCPLYQGFDYRFPSILGSPQLGVRVRVNFGNRTMIGVVIAIKNQSNVPADKLKDVEVLLDTTPALSPDLFELSLWISSYYHAPIGEVFQLSLPLGLRQGDPRYAEQKLYAITEEGIIWREDPANQNARVKVAILEHFSMGDGLVEAAILAKFPTFKNHRKMLLNEGLLTTLTQYDDALSSPKMPLDNGSLTLTSTQQRVVDELTAKRSGVALLEGVTGSGKTAVYTEIAREMLKQGRQVLMLVPEIGLTPQFVGRIEAALKVRVGVIHSQISDSERLNTWRDAELGRVDLLIGTRSALFTPFRDLGLIILDEAHDSSYLQRDGVRYSAHNSAIQRASLLKIPIILGTATPSFESLKNVVEGRYSHHLLTERVQGELPTWEIIDCNTTAIYDGLTTPLLDEIEATLARQEQVLIFLNRRGFSPVITCLDCGWMAECTDCSAYLNYHRATGLLHCHHCAKRYPYPKVCPKCNGRDFKLLGAGTQKIEKALSDAFPLATVLRFDRDNVGSAASIASHLDQIASHSADIIIGTQMLAKGHDFPNITLVALVNSDGLFFSNDFRAEEKLAQLLMQVSGRAGRGDKRGKVIVQTLFPEHALFHELPKVGYHQFAKSRLEIRKLVDLPPYTFQAFLQAEAKVLTDAQVYLEQLMAEVPVSEGLHKTPVMPNYMSRRQGYFRVHAILQATSRGELHRVLYRLVRLAEFNKRHDVRFLVEVDPIEFN